MLYTRRRISSLSHKHNENNANKVEVEIEIEINQMNKDSAYNIFTRAKKERKRDRHLETDT